MSPAAGYGETPIHHTPGWRRDIAGSCRLRGAAVPAGCSTR
jgi:hypothetical protein